MLCPSHAPWLDHSNYTWQEYKLWSSSLYNFPQSPLISSFSSSNILLSSLFSNTLSLCSSLVSETEFRVHTKPHAKLYFWYYFYVCRQQTGRRKVLDWMVASITRIQSPLKFLLNEILICYCRSQIFSTVPRFQTSITFLYVMICPCILVTWQQHILKFLYVYFFTNLLASVN
jgi:hypothetical protein